MARLSADHISRTQGVTAVVENRAGANGMIGVEAVSRAAPDGNTVLVTANTYLLDDLLRLNQQAMVAASERARAESWKAVVSTAIVAILALALAMAFAWRFTSYIVDPIATLTEKARRIGEGDFEQ